MNQDDAPRSENLLPAHSMPPEVSETSDATSVALSETETLAYSKPQRMELQDTFDENYTAYLPFILRRLRHEHDRMVARQEEASYGHDVDMICEYSSDTDSEKTAASALEGWDRRIMHRETARYNRKRQLVVASEFIRNHTYVFPDPDSFRVFRYLRSNNKRLRKNQMIVYDGEGNIKRIRGVSGLEPDLVSAAGVVDARPHIIPLEYKLKGSGLPLFKILVPYMSSFRKKVPYMVFRRFKEVPAQPLLLRPDADEDEGFETYDYCTIHTKTFQQFKRYVLHFTPEGAEPFQVIVFQNNFRPFSDFSYKNTRFRVVGLSLVTAYLMNYNPELKLIVIDENQAALCDNLVNRQLHGRRGSRSALDAADLFDPVPSENNRVLREDENGFLRTSRRNYIPNDMPPFGRFVDSCVYPVELLILPRKYSEVGKVELYQAVDTSTYPDMTSTLSVDDDVLVLTTVLLMLRETSLRTTNRYSNGSLVSRVGNLGASPLVPGGGLGFNLATSM